MDKKRVWTRLRGIAGLALAMMIVTAAIGGAAGAEGARSKAPETEQSESAGKAQEAEQSEAVEKAPEAEQSEATGKAPEAEQSEAAENAPTAEKGETPEATPEIIESLTLLIQVRETDLAPGYVLVQGDQSIGFLPLPTEGEVWQAIVQRPDGETEWRNVLRMTPEGFSVTEADCEGHDCMEQGEVTLENMQDRLLWNMVICAPHRLTLSLYTPAEAAEISRQWLGF